MSGVRVIRPDGVAVMLPEPWLPVSRSAALSVWDAALCAQTDPELFFPDSGRTGQSRRAVAMCRRCEVRSLCLATFGPVLGYGVVGGRTARQRRRHPLDPPTHSQLLEDHGRGAGVEEVA